jgi:glyoxylase-like metal-dependent hydrolase (beta-lactamase superfamily II)
MPNAGGYSIPTAHPVSPGRPELRKASALMAAIVPLLPITAFAEDARAALEKIAQAQGAPTVKSLRYTGSGLQFAVGQSAAPGAPWPRFNLKSFTRAIDYETASLRDELVRTQAEDPPRGGGQQPIQGELRQIFVVSGEYAWNVAGDAATPAPIALAERQFELWATPQGLIKAAMANNATVQARTIAFTVPGRFTVKATVDAQNLVEKIEARLPSPVLGEMPVEISYSGYRDFGGVRFPTKIRQVAGGFPALELTVSDVQPNAAVDIQVPDAVRQARAPYAQVATQMVTDGVWYLTGGTHHSVVVEMSDHVIVVEGPLNDERALAVIAETRRLVPGKPIRYVVNTHHHFDHAGGLRAFAAEGAAVITHEINRAFLERALAAPATLRLDRLAQSGRKGTVEGVGDRRVLTDGTRTVEIHHIAGNLHDDGLLMIYLPKERLLCEADVYAPAPPNAPAPAAVNPFSVNLADNITKLGLAVDRLLPLHGRIAALRELELAVGRSR